MKTRQGFVSNSSTTSFCIYGVHATARELGATLKDSDGNVIEDIDRNALYEILEKELKGMDIHYGPDYDDGDELYIGKEWSSIKDDETGRDFKLGIRDKILKKFPNYKGEFHTFSEAWRDG